MVQVSATELRAVMGAMAKDDVRGYLNYLFLDPGPTGSFDGGGAQIVGCDGFVLARCTAIVDPSYGVNALNRLIEARRKAKMNNPEQLLFRPLKAPAKRTSIVSIDLELGYMWPSDNPSAQPTSVLVCQDGSKYVDWRRVDAWEGKKWVAENKVRRIALDFSIVSRVFPDAKKAVIEPGLMLKEKGRVEDQPMRITGINPEYDSLRVTLMECRSE
jgi:hypothetical protein